MMSIYVLFLRASCSVGFGIYRERVKVRFLGEGEGVNEPCSGLLLTCLPFSHVFNHTVKLSFFLF